MEIPTVGHSNRTQDNASTSFFTADDTKDAPFKTILEEVREKGLVEYAAEKRLEELKEKILDKLGITEEKLKNMTPEQRADLAKRVDEEIQRLMAAERELDKNQDEWNFLKINQVNSPTFLTGFDMNDGVVGGKVEGSQPIDLFKVFSEMDKAEKDDEEDYDRV